MYKTIPFYRNDAFNAPTKGLSRSVFISFWSPVNNRWNDAQSTHTKNTALVNSIKNLLFIISIVVLLKISSMDPGGDKMFFYHDKPKALLIRIGYKGAMVFASLDLKNKKKQVFLP